MGGAANAGCSPKASAEAKDLRKLPSGINHLQGAGAIHFGGCCKLRESGLAVRPCRLSSVLSVLRP